jgi:hypothetical protein
VSENQAIREAYPDDKYRPIPKVKSDSQAAPAAKPAQGGYKVGNKYGGLEYLGGDPNNQESWKK